MVQLNLGINGSDFNNDARAIAQHVRLVETEIDKLRRSSAVLDGRWNLLSRSARRIGQDVAALGVGFLGLRGIQEASSSIAQFDRSLIGVGKTTNTAGEELEAFGSDVLELSSRLEATNTELLETTRVAGQLGVRGSQDLLRFTETFARLESATDVAGEKGALRFARILQLSRDGIEASVQGGAALTGLGNQAVATESEILAVAERIAGGLVQFDAGAQQILALATSFREIGVEAELARSSVTRASINFRDAIAVGETDERLQVLIGLLGRTREELRQTFNDDPIQFFRDFLAEVNKVSESDQAASLLLDKFGLATLRFGATIPSLATSIDVLDKNLALAAKQFEVAGTAQDALIQESDRAIDSLIGSANRLRNTFVRAIIDPTRDSTDSVQDFIDTTTDAIGILAGFTDISLEASEGSEQLANGIRSVGIALGALGVGAFVSSLGSATAAFGAASTAAGGFVAALGAAPLVAFTALAAGSFFALERLRSSQEDYIRSTRELEDQQSSLANQTLALRNVTNQLFQSRQQNNLLSQIENLTDYQSALAKTIEETKKLADTPALDVETGEFTAEATQGFEDLLEVVENARELFPQAEREINQVFRSLADQTFFQGTTDPLSPTGFEELIEAQDAIEPLEKLREVLARVIENRKRDLDELANRETESKAYNVALEEETRRLREQNAEIQFEIELLGLTNSERIRAIALREADINLKGRTTEAIEAELDSLRNLSEELDRQENLQRLGQDAGQELGDALFDIAENADNAADSVENLIKSLSKLVFNTFFTSQISDFLGSLAGGLGSGGGGNGAPISGTVGPQPLSSAKGNVFEFRDGGFPQLLTKPMAFGLKGGNIGTAAEQGPELAIAPLSRDPAGRLGVRIQDPQRANTSTSIRVQKVVVMQSKGPEDALGRTAKQLRRRRQASLN